MTNLELLVDFHKDAERQGPGSPQETVKALDLIEISNKAEINIADIGCGTGGQTITLASNINGQISAVDIFPEFLDKLNLKSNEAGFGNKITTIKSSMAGLPFANNEFDVIWSEGAIYNIGFKRGICEWKKYLRQNGYIAISEITWLTNSRPKEIENYWIKEYPEIDTASSKIKILEENGYAPVGYFVLSQVSWMKNYYKPMQKRFLDFLQKHNNSEEALNIIEEHKEEISLYQKYKHYYGYGFYIARKNCD